MGMDIELLQELKAVIAELKSFISTLKIEQDGSINTNMTGIINVESVSIADPVNQNQKALVDSSGRLLVSTPPPTPPPNTTPIILTGFGAVSGNSDSLHVITPGKKLVIGRLLAGAEEMTKAGRITLYENPDGNNITLNLVATLYVNGSSDVADLSETFQGNGTRRMVLRRTNLGGGSKELFARFEGYEE